MTDNEIAARLRPILESLMADPRRYMGVAMDIVAVIREAVAAEQQRCAAICRRIQEEADGEHGRTADPGAGSDGAERAAEEIEKGGAR